MGPLQLLLVQLTSFCRTRVTQNSSIKMVFQRLVYDQDLADINARSNIFAGMGASKS